MPPRFPTTSTVAYTSSAGLRALPDGQDAHAPDATVEPSSKSQRDIPRPPVSAALLSGHRLPELGQNRSSSFRAWEDRATVQPGQHHRDIYIGSHMATQSGSSSLPATGSTLQQVNSAKVQPSGDSSTPSWHLDTTLHSTLAVEASEYFFEPQGELLCEQNVHDPSDREFHIPHTVGNPPKTWHFDQGAAGSKQSVSEELNRPTGALMQPSTHKRKPASDQDLTASQPSAKRPMMSTPESTDESSTPIEGQRPSQIPRSQSVGGSAQPREKSSEAGMPPPSTLPTAQRSGIGSTPREPLRRTLTDPSTPMVLPARKVFPIQIGDKLFRLSGASISSDAPSYFSQFFEEQLRQSEGAGSVRTLYIDRDPTTFEDIALHLQGYHIEPRDGPHFVKLFADAQFFSLPRLTQQLFSSPIYVRIGESEFQIPRDLFNNPGDSPNYFSLGFAIFFTTPNDVFPGLSQRTLLRPPSILPPSVPNRSAATFSDLLHMLKGYPLHIRNEEHRAELLRDARYFHLKGLEQKIIPHSITYNLARKVTEIVMRLEDIRQSGISFVADRASPSPAGAASPTSSAASTPPSPGWVYYQRPYVDSEAYCLILEIGGEESTLLSMPRAPSSSGVRFARATFYRQTLSRVTNLFSVIASKMNLPVTQPLGLMMMERGAGVASLPVSPGNSGLSEERVKVRIAEDADVTLDGKPWMIDSNGESSEDEGMQVDSGQPPQSKGKQRLDPAAEDNGDEDEEEWVVKTAQWRLRVRAAPGGAQAGKSGVEIILGAVKIEAFSTERARNASRSFLH